VVGAVRGGELVLEVVDMILQRRRLTRPAPNGPGGPGPLAGRRSTSWLVCRLVGGAAELLPPVDLGELGLVGDADHVDGAAAGPLVQLTGLTCGLPGP
jgi:hypothetical protein